MAFIVETGSANPEATSYVSLAFADDYHLTFGNTNWPVTDVGSEDAGAAVIASKQLALIRATQAVDLLFGEDFKSHQFTQEQTLEFPRFAFYINKRQICNSDVIPKQLKEAVCEIALKDILGEEINPDVSENSVIKSQKLKLDTLEKDVVYNDTATNEGLSGFLKIERLIQPLLIDEADEVYNMLGR